MLMTHLSIRMEWCSAPETEIMIRENIVRPVLKGSKVPGGTISAIKQIWTVGIYVVPTNRTLME